MRSSSVEILIIFLCLQEIKRFGGPIASRGTSLSLGITGIQITTREDPGTHQLTRAQKRLMSDQIFITRLRTPSVGRRSGPAARGFGHTIGVLTRGMFSVAFFTGGRMERPACLG